MKNRALNQTAGIRLLLAFYGDDFTGSTDALEQLEKAGLHAVLFLEPPGPEQLARFGKLNAVGLAGRTRSLPPRELEAELRPGLQKLKALKPLHIHYKVCSTFDSSPQAGSIGKVIDVAAGIFQKPFVPVLAGTPALGRYCVFGNLFARFGTGSAGPIHRLDRHPSISRHPVTPMKEADLLLHLQRQTRKRIGLFDILKVRLPARAADAALRNLADECDIVFFDALCPEDLPRIGQLLGKYASRSQPLFSVGSSAVETALSSLWKKPAHPMNPPDPVSSVLVASGSCSPVTIRQIQTALSSGFVQVELAPQNLFSPASAAKECKRAAGLAARLLKAGRSVIIHTDGAKPNKGLTNRAGSRTADIVGRALGTVMRRVLEQVSVPRVCIAGGDTASCAASALGIEAVEMIAPLVTGAPVCRVHARGSPVDRLQAVFKGGQVGDDQFFVLLKKGIS